MGIRNIVKTTDEVTKDILSKKSKPLEKITEKEINLIKDMEDTLSFIGGVGLAAVQVGVLKRIFILSVPFKDLDDVKLNIDNSKYIFDYVKPENAENDENNYQLKIAVINPTLSDLKGEECGEEACLSVPDLSGDVKRFSSLTLKGTTIENEDFTLNAKGFVARAIQHEFDHLEGILYTDKLIKEKK